jgi:hypothetical protein
MIRLFFTLICLQSLALGETYYVDYEAGDNSRAGTSEGTSWKHIPDDPAATGVPAAATIVASDIISIRRGTTYTPTNGSIVLKNGVIYDGGGWGTGANAIMHGGNNSTTLTCFSPPSGSNGWTIKRMKITDFGGYPDVDPWWVHDAVIASVDTVTDTITTVEPHGFLNNWEIGFTTPDGGVFPAPLLGGVNQGAGSSEPRYYVKAQTANTFQVGSSTSTATLYNLTSSGSGTVYVWRRGKGLARSGSGIYSANGVNNCLVEDVEFAEIGAWQPEFPMMSEVTGQGILINNATNLTVRRCDFTKMRAAIALGSAGATGVTNNILIEDCVIHDYINWGIDIGVNADGGTVSNVLIDGCTIKNMHQYDKGNWNSWGEKPHTDGIFFRNNFKRGVWSNVVVNGCSFFADYSGSSQGGTANIFISGGPSITITNNIFGKNAYPTHISIGGGFQYIPTDGKQILRIYNNTFAGNTCPIILSGETTALKREAYIQNNILLRDANANSPMLYRPSSTDTPQATVLNKNLYWSDLWTVAQKYIYQMPALTRFAVVQTYGLETNGKYNNPLFPNRTGDFATWDLSLPTGSNAIGMGENLSAYFTTDFYGNTRPASGAWDAGAISSAYTPSVDSTAPNLISATLMPDGQSAVLVFSEPMQNISLAHYAVSGHTLGTLTGSGTTWQFVLSPKRQAGPSFSMTYTSGAGRSADLAGNLLASGTFTIVNNSLEATPEPPRAQRRGPAAVKRKPIGF